MSQPESAPEISSKFGCNGRHFFIPVELDNGSPAWLCTNCGETKPR